MLADDGPVIGSFHFDHLAHFVEAGSEADSDTIGQRFLGGIIGFIEVIGGEDGDFSVVIAGIDDLGHGIPDPIGRLGSAEFIEDEDFGLIDGLEHAEFGRM